MYQELQRKVTEEKPSYSREEIQWLLEHLGDPSPEIRDDLVFTSLARGIQEGLFTQEQFQFISEKISSDGGLEKEIDKLGLPTLERSFRALIYANLLSVDANPQSMFYQRLQAEIRIALLHPDFPKNRVPEGLDILCQLFKRISIRFIDDEDWRLARVLYEPILQGKLEQEQLASWIKAVDFPIEEREDFYKFSNFRSCLLEVYVQLDQRNILQADLKETIQSFQY